MRRYESNQQFYDHIDAMVLSLKAIGETDISDEIDMLLHKTAWTTTSELFGELRIRLEKLLQAEQPLPAAIKSDIQGCINTINRAWTQPNGAV